MKNQILILLVTFFFGHSLLAANKEVKVNVNGMVCGFCAQGITKKFKAEPGVASVDVKLSEKVVSLSLKPDGSVTDDRITELLKDSGYTVVNIERK
jgi:copper chaperone CopZ